MIRSATIRLTLWYLAILMLLSICFSLFLYQVWTREFDRGLRPAPFFDENTGPGSTSQFEELRRTRGAEGRANLQNDLILFNLTILILGGAASYALARRHLRPIEDALEAQSRFTADASHELRTPLTAMQTETEVALRNPELTVAGARNLLESNLEELAKLRALSEGLLRLARENGQGIPLKRVSLADVAAEAEKRVAAAARSRRIKLENTAGDVPVLGDHESLVELVAVLLENAIKYSDPKSSVKIGTGRHGKQGYLSIRDEGYGIKASDIPHIFSRFYRADLSRSKEKVDGYGLGLSIAKKIADLHRGSIEVKSTPGHGSTFTVKLPLDPS